MVKLTLVVAIFAFVLALPAQAARPTPPHSKMWLCIHGKEGSWQDAGAPYYGGLQMGWWFMSTYAPELLRRKGTAEHWTPLEQMWVAERAFKRSGYSIRWLRGQWPNTSWGCV